METTRTIRCALIASAIAVPMFFIIDFAVHYSEPISVPNMSLDDYLRLSVAEQDRFVRTENGLKQIEGFEKIWYLVRAIPGTYIKEALIYFLPVFAAAYLGAILERKYEAKSNNTIETDT